MIKKEDYSENWIAVADRIPGEPGRDSEEVVVFQNGYAAITDHEKRQGGPWGMAFGFYDAGKGCFYVHGRPSVWVTHWMPKEKPPLTTAEDYVPHAGISLPVPDAQEIMALLAQSQEPLLQSLRQRLQYSIEGMEQEGRL